MIWTMGMQFGMSYLLFLFFKQKKLKLHLRECSQLGGYVNFIFIKLIYLNLLKSKRMRNVKMSCKLGLFIKNCPTVSVTKYLLKLESENKVGVKTFVKNKFVQNCHKHDYRTVRIFKEETSC